MENKVLTQANLVVEKPKVNVIETGYKLQPMPDPKSQDRDRQPAKWIKRVFLGATTEIGYSDKGVIGFWINNRWAVCHTVESLTELITHTNTVQSIIIEATVLAKKREADKNLGKLTRNKERAAAKLFDMAKALKDQGVSDSEILTILAAAKA